MPESGHYAYFSSLERTIKVALALYMLLLLAGSAWLIAGIAQTWEILRRIDNSAFYAVLFSLFAFGGVYYVVSKIHWLGELHIWLDRRFFGFLEKSNEVIFQAMVHVLESDDQSYARDLRSEERYSMIHSVFSRLAENYRLFDTLMESGIFRSWIWYWVMNYGTFTFSLLTIGSFAAMLTGDDPFVRTLFTVCWIAALLHLAVNLVLGHYLTGMTRKVSESIVLTYKPQITLMLRDSIAR
ncbi:MAG TPA: hypothetical protein VI932_00750 [Bacteroidota bacterium]|nr:hypothetical protein [Bacteroidota bacterium]